MKINSPAEDRIIVDLTEQDMTELDITYEDMDYSTIETRRVIWTLLDEAGRVLGRELDPSRKMVIEAMPKNEGGCILCFTILDCRRKPSAKQFLKKQSEFLICDFDNLDLLFDAAKAFGSFDTPTESSLYENNGRYRLVISCCGEIHRIRSRFSEFCKPENGNALLFEFTREHWKEIASKNAISYLCGKVS